MLTCSASLATPLPLPLPRHAGQSMGAWLCHGITLELEGDANDYVAKVGGWLGMGGQGQRGNGARLHPC